MRESEWDVVGPITTVVLFFVLLGLYTSWRRDHLETPRPRAAAEIIAPAPRAEPDARDRLTRDAPIAIPPAKPGDRVTL